MSNQARDNQAATLSVTPTILRTVNATIKLDRIRESLSEMRRLYRIKKDTADKYTEYANAVATLSSVDASTLKQFVAALEKDELQKFESRANQMDLFASEFGGL